jgi:hypothetical protein
MFSPEQVVGQVQASEEVQRGCPSARSQRRYGGRSTEPQLYHVSRALFTSSQTIIDSSPIMKNGSATRDTTPPYAGTVIELTLTARYEASDDQEVAQELRKEAGRDHEDPNGRSQRAQKAMARPQGSSSVASARRVRVPVMLVRSTRSIRTRSRTDNLLRSSFYSQRLSGDCCANRTETHIAGVGRRQIDVQPIRRRLAAGSQVRWPQKPRWTTSASSSSAGPCTSIGRWPWANTSRHPTRNPSQSGPTS